jgi:3-oxoacyl-[acyl-carrier protein] reductase
MLLEGKNAVIYGGAGAIGSAVARGFVRQGAKVHLVGRTLERLDGLADELRAAGGQVSTASVDALDEDAVDAHIDAVVAESGSVDVSFNLISYDDVQGTPLAQMAVEDFVKPIDVAMRSMFITARAAARPMMEQRSGVILTFGGGGDPIRNNYYIGGFQVALGAVEYLRRQLAVELGEYGIRVVTLHTGGVVDTLPADFPGRKAIVDSIVGATLLGRAATFEDVGNVAAFAASDLARTITGSSINITCGAATD